MGQPLVPLVLYVLQSTSYLMMQHFSFNMGKIALFYSKFKTQKSKSQIRGVNVYETHSYFQIYTDEQKHMLSYSCVAPTKQDMDSKSPLKVFSGIWNQDISSRTSMQGGAQLD